MAKTINREYYAGVLVSVYVRAGNIGNSHSRRGSRLCWSLRSGVLSCVIGLTMRSGGKQLPSNTSICLPDVILSFSHSMSPSPTDSFSSPEGNTCFKLS